jgi:hypothetical protein
MSPPVLPPQGHISGTAAIPPTPPPPQVAATAAATAQVAPPPAPTQITHNPGLVGGAPLPQLKLEDLSLQHVLGGGAFGQVWKGDWRGTPVAVKVLSAVCQRNLPDHVLAAFEDEVAMLARLRHPNVRIYYNIRL